MPIHHHYQLRLNDSLPIDTAFLDSIGTDAYAEAHASTPEPTTADVIFSTVAYSLSAILLATTIYRLIRLFIDPAYRERYNEKARQKAEKRRQRQRAIDSMSTTDRLLYEQNKELRRIHWYITLRDLFAPRRRR